MDCCDDFPWRINLMTFDSSCKNQITLLKTYNLNAEFEAGPACDQ